jgi:hypothetical protein
MSKLHVIANGMRETTPIVGEATCPVRLDVACDPWSDSSCDPSLDVFPAAHEASGGTRPGDDAERADRIG